MRWYLALIFFAVGSLLTFAARAESTYGHSLSAAAGGASASARLDLDVRVPLLILLRVGSTGSTVDALKIEARFNGVPAGVATLANGNNLASAWDGSAPSLSLNPASERRVRASAWTNARAGGRLGWSSSVSGANPPAGFTLGMILVASGSVGGCVLNHPGTSLANPASTSLFGRNQVCSADWTYRILLASLPNLGAGAVNVNLVYTATTL